MKPKNYYSVIPIFYPKKWKSYNVKTWVKLTNDFFSTLSKPFALDVNDELVFQIETKLEKFLFWLWKL